MANSTKSIKIIGVHDIAPSRKLTSTWLQEGDPLALDAEGLNLGATGRLTLLQIATRDGTVTLFDVINPNDFEDTASGKRLLEQGGVKDLLESSGLLKITHGCHGDLGALLHQFDINVQNVFDTQAAHLAIEYAKGHKFPLMLKLDILVERYTSIALESKNFQEEWLKDQYMFWGRRPLSPKAKEYAAGDVKILHQLYDAMNREIERTEECREPYEIFLDLEMNEQRDEQRISEKDSWFRKQRMEQVFENASGRSTDEISEDEIRAILAFRLLIARGVVKETGLPPHVKLLEQTLVRELECTLKDFQSGRKTDFDDIDWRSIKAFRFHPDSSLCERVKNVRKQLKILQASSMIEELNLKVVCGSIKGLDDLTASDFETINIYREFREDLRGDPCVNSTIIGLETDLSRRQLTEWEELQTQGLLAHVFNPAMAGKVRTLCKHPEIDVQERAKSMSNIFNILKAKRGIKGMIQKFRATPNVDFEALNEDEKWTIQRYRQHKKSMTSAEHHQIIRSLERQLNNQDLDRFEEWRRTGQLTAKAGNVEWAVIRTLTEHDDPSVRARAMALNKERPQRNRSAANSASRGRGRGGVRGRGGRRW